MELTHATAGAAARRRLVSRGPVKGWGIVEYRERDGDPPRYAVEYMGQRRAWGMRDQETATRWMERLIGPVREPVAIRIARPR